MKKSVSPAFPMPGKDRPNVLPLEGEIDLHVSPTVTASLNMMIEKKPKLLVIDLSRVTYIDSAGLAAFIEGMQKVCRKPCAPFSKSLDSIKYFEFSRTWTRRWPQPEPEFPGSERHSLQCRTATHAR